MRRSGDGMAVITTFQGEALVSMQTAFYRFAQENGYATELLDKMYDNSLGVEKLVATVAIREGISDVPSVAGLVPIELTGRIPRIRTLMVGNRDASIARATLQHTIDYLAGRPQTSGLYAAAPDAFACRSLEFAGFHPVVDHSSSHYLCGAALRELAEHA